MSCETYIETFMNQLGTAHGMREVVPIETSRWIVTTDGDKSNLVEYDTPDNLLVVWRYSGVVPAEAEQAAAYEKLLEMNTTSWQNWGVRAALSLEGEIVLCRLLPAHQCNNTSFAKTCRALDGFLARFQKRMGTTSGSQDLAGLADPPAQRQFAS